MKRSVFWFIGWSLDNKEAPVFQEGSNEVCGCQAFCQLQDLFKEEAMVHSVICGRQINKDCSCNQFFLESILNVLSEVQKLSCCRSWLVVESGLLRDDGWFSNRGKPVENQALKQLVEVAQQRDWAEALFMGWIFAWFELGNNPGLSPDLWDFLSTFTYSLARGSISSSEVRSD